VAAFVSSVPSSCRDKLARAQPHPLRLRPLSIQGLAALDAVTRRLRQKADQLPRAPGLAPLLAPPLSSPRLWAPAPACRGMVPPNQVGVHGAPPLQRATEQPKPSFRQPALFRPAPVARRALARGPQLRPGRADAFAVLGAQGALPFWFVGETYENECGVDTDIMHERDAAWGDPPGG
jgi:hypothetical protein